MGGNISFNLKNKKIIEKNDPLYNFKLKKENKKEIKIESYDVKDAINLALSNKNTINVELTINLNNLPKMKTLSLTDAFVVVLLEKTNEKVKMDSKKENKKENNSKEFQENEKQLKEKEEIEYIQIGHTEVALNNLNPMFKKKFLIPNYGKKRKIKFLIFDTNNSKNIYDDPKLNLIGYVEEDLLVICKHEVYESPILHPKRKKNGNIIIRKIESDIEQFRITMQFEFIEIISRNKLFFEMITSADKNQNFIIYTSEWQENKNKKCSFNSFKINKNNISNDDSSIKISLYEQKFGKIMNTKLVAEVELTFKNLMNNKGSEMDMRKGVYNNGKIIIKEIDNDNSYSFMDYLYMDYCLKPIIAIDFTLSNLKKDKEIKKELFEAIEKLGCMFDNFDDDKRIMTLGFGAKLKPYYNIVSHCFSVNENIFKPNIEGIDKINDIIKENIENRNFVPHGPTIFSEVIRFSSEIAKYMKKNENKYYVVLLIISNGKVSDLELAIDEIILADKEPLSIIICSLEQNENTEILEKLDSDNDKLKSSRLNKKSTRDIVQYFYFDEYKNNLKNLASALFQEIPEQFINYITSKENNFKKPKNKKEKTSKKDFLNKMENKKKKSLLKPHIFENFLKHKKKEFKKSLLKLGFDLNNINDILDHNGIPAIDYNLMNEYFGLKQVIDKLENQKPINIEELTQVNSHSNNNKILPKTDVFLIKENNNKNSSEWNKTKKISYNRTKNYLLQLENEELNYIENNLPKKIINLKDKYYEEENTLEKEKKNNNNNNNYDDLINLLEKNKVENDVNFGIINKKDNLCLICGKNKINIILLNCGDAYLCDQCVSKIENKCLICKNEVIENIKADILKEDKSYDYDGYSENDSLLDSNSYKLSIEFEKNDEEKNNNPSAFDENKSIINNIENKKINYSTSLNYKNQNFKNSNFQTFLNK